MVGCTDTFLPVRVPGRFVCAEQNLQQIPRALKHCFGYKETDNHYIIYSDYSQLELRCIAAITAEENMVDKFRSGVDIHNFVAEMTFGKGWTKEDRVVAKTENFNLLYGGGVEMIQSILIQQAGRLIPLEKLTSLVEKWRLLFPGIVRWQNVGRRDFNAGRLGATPLGRKYRGKRVTDQINIQNQGFGSEIAKLALHYMLRDNGLKQFNASIINFVHDSYIIEIPKTEDYKACCKHVADSMIKGWLEGTKLVKVKDLPMPVEVKVGYNWGDIENDTNIVYRYES